MTLSVLFVAAEMLPFAKTGGLGDVVAALPRALRTLGPDVRVLLPGYPYAKDQLRSPRTAADLGDLLELGPARLLEGTSPDGHTPVWLLDSPTLFERAGGPYLDEHGRLWPDNAQRFAALAHAAARLAFGDLQVGWTPQVVHCHDWHTALLPLLLKVRPRPRPASVFTIHNLAFQGEFGLDVFDDLGLPDWANSPGALEFFGRLNFLKAAVGFADKVTTVSPTYAREIQTSAFGCGLDGMLHSRGDAVFGILNGIDDESWNPATDPTIAAPYHRGDRSGKQACKAALQAELGLQVDPARPLLAFSSRLTHQKMADVVFDCLPAFFQRVPDLQIAVLGRGEGWIEDGFRIRQIQFAGRLAVSVGYDEASAHRLIAGSDMLLHGSRFEPCGLTQLYAMVYGTPPIVTRVGGLADTVVDATPEALQAGLATGFVFDPPSHGPMIYAVERAVGLWRDYRGEWDRLQQAGMAADYSWTRSASAYADLYRSLLPLTQERGSAQRLR